MVNVGGRSKGCSNCRRRRIKCDEIRPICRRCQRSGLDCDGPKDIAFIEGTIVKSRRTQKQATTLVRRDPEEQNVVVQPKPQSTDFWRHDERDVYVCYARQFFLPNGPIDLGLQDLHLADITIPNQKSEVDGPIFGQAVLSFATVYFGVQHKQANILTQGYSRHGAALKQLNHALSDPRCYIRDDVVLSVITLAILECLVPTGPKNYLKHMLGLEKLLELREPAAITQCSRKTSDLYKGVRSLILFASLRTRTPSILARPVWKAVLRVNCSEQELQEQDLCDVLADCTVLMAEQDKLISQWDRGMEQYERLKRKALSLLTFLSAWKAQWEGDRHNISLEESAHYGDWHPSPASSVGNDTSGPPMPFRLESDAVAKMLMLYSTTLIYILQILASLLSDNLKDYNNETPSPVPWPLYILRDNDIWECISKAEWVAAKRLAALQVGRCIPSYLDHKRARDQQFSLPMVQWAVTTAWMALGGNDTTEGRWVMDLSNGRDSQAVAKGVWDA